MGSSVSGSLSGERATTNLFLFAHAFKKSISDLQQHEINNNSTSEHTLTVVEVLLQSEDDVPPGAETVELGARQTGWISDVGFSLYV